jgi:sugar O-acyltransferase (sialic acid O-acetyltransferase NeuD family)
MVDRCEMSQIKLLLFGGAGHASDVLGLVEDLRSIEFRQDIEVVGLVAKPPIDKSRFEKRNIAIVDSDSELDSIRASHYMLAVGDGTLRRKLTSSVPVHLAPISLIHPHCAVGTNARIGYGTVVFGGVRMSPRVRVGNYVVVHYGSLIGHDSQIRDFATVLPGSIIGGGVEIGECALIGSGAIILENIRIGAESKVGAGAVVTKDVSEGSTVVGIPARAI